MAARQATSQRESEKDLRPAVLTSARLTCAAIVLGRRVNWTKSFAERTLASETGKYFRKYLTQLRATVLARAPSRRLSCRRPASHEWVTLTGERFRVVNMCAR